MYIQLRELDTIVRQHSESGVIVAMMGRFVSAGIITMEQKSNMPTDEMMGMVEDFFNNKSPVPSVRSGFTGSITHHMGDIFYRGHKVKVCAWMCKKFEFDGHFMCVEAQSKAKIGDYHMHGGVAKEIKNTVHNEKGEVFSMCDSRYINISESIIIPKRLVEKFL